MVVLVLAWWPLLLCGKLKCGFLSPKQIKEGIQEDSQGSLNSTALGALVLFWATRFFRGCRENSETSQPANLPSLEPEWSLVQPGMAFLLGAIVACTYLHIISRIGRVWLGFLLNRVGYSKTSSFEHFGPVPHQLQMLLNPFRGLNFLKHAPHILGAFWGLLQQSGNPGLGEGFWHSAGLLFFLSCVHRALVNK